MRRMEGEEPRDGVVEGRARSAIPAHPLTRAALKRLRFTPPETRIVGTRHEIE